MVNPGTVARIVLTRIKVYVSAGLALPRIAHSLILHKPKVVNTGEFSLWKH